MIRIGVADVPYVYGFHTALRTIPENSIKAALSSTTDDIILCNLADYIRGCIDIDIHYCCMSEYCTQDFIEALYFMEGLLKGTCSESYRKSFRKILRLFGIETLLLSGYLSSITGRDFHVIPTLPCELKDLSEANIQLNISDTNLIPSVEDWLELSGWLSTHFTFASEFDYITHISPERCATNKYASYEYQMLSSLREDSYDKFLLYKEDS